jgi:hypothetical protein
MERNAEAVNMTLRRKLRQRRVSLRRKAELFSGEGPTCRLPPEHLSVLDHHEHRCDADDVHADVAHEADALDDNVRGDGDGSHNAGGYKAAGAERLRHGKVVHAAKHRHDLVVAREETGGEAEVGG